MKTLGIDGCTGGWIAVLITERGYQIRFQAQIDDFVDWMEEVDFALIDMPIGLPENESEALMRPEKEARQLLGKKASSVFNVPCRQALQEEVYTRSNIVNKQILGKGLSKQSFYIGSKMKELDLFLTRNPAFKNKLKESHPELVFQKLSADGLPVIEKKRTKEGMEKRLQIIGKYCFFAAQFEKQLSTDTGLIKIQDDAIDAYGLAVAGSVGQTKGFYTIPEIPVSDSEGLLMCMTLPYI